jgi:low affinity Fe/Cu permease
MKATGSPAAFVIALGSVIIWAFFGPVYHYSENWQLVINTGTTIVTFLMVFIIQYSQNKDTRAMHLKLDEVIRAIEAADNNKIGIEELTHEEILKIAEK